MLAFSISGSRLMPALAGWRIRPGEEEMGGGGGRVGIV